ncbi:hypothetical protein [Legionella maceachernii]|uniref:Uncharacterized protein n=1 Tax=Legionella maceachernii TaxID=466 RepID=A0A0W0VTX0_9GAMM|nr:hypothetical protein [Legionella maceachernii]KTD23505.1 hypothetical protein Lmac_3181 [Legionella maceachernii]SJZ70168.1 hypothetical protein SAMN02745128_00836 [Legionella maceachernii]SUP02261.1 Uncharacterised protein [Legionella maceachernii]
MSRLGSTLLQRSLPRVWRSLAFARDDKGGVVLSEAKDLLDGAPAKSREVLRFAQDDEVQGGSPILLASQARSLNIN